MLDYGYRSKCCKAPLRMGKKKVKKTQQIMDVWVCCACKTKDVDIIPKEEALSQSAAPRLIVDMPSDRSYDEE